MFGGTSPLRYRYTNMMMQHLDEFEKVKQVRANTLLGTTDTSLPPWPGS